jgi:hypothetical protein
MRICTTVTSSMASMSGRVPDQRAGEAPLRRPAPGRGAWVVRGASPSPDVVLVGSGQQVAVAMAVAELLTGDGVAARVVAVATGPDAGPGDGSGIDGSGIDGSGIDGSGHDGLVPPGVPCVTVCGDGCPETLEGIRLSAHDAIAAATQGW